MNLSKDEAKKALALITHPDVVPFLELCVKKLPTEKSIAAEKQRLKDERKAAKAAAK